MSFSNIISVLILQKTINTTITVTPNSEYPTFLSVIKLIHYFPDMFTYVALNIWQIHKTDNIFISFRPVWLFLFDTLIARVLESKSLKVWFKQKQ